MPSTERGEGVAGILKNEMPSLVLSEKLSFIRLPPDKLQNFWQVNMSQCDICKTMVGCCIRKSHIKMNFSFFDFELGNNCDSDSEVMSL